MATVSNERFLNMSLDKVIAEKKRVLRTSTKKKSEVSRSAKTKLLNTAEARRKAKKQAALNAKRGIKPTPPAKKTPTAKGKKKGKKSNATAIASKVQARPTKQKVRGLTASKKAKKAADAKKRGGTKNSTSKKITPKSLVFTIKNTKVKTTPIVKPGQKTSATKVKKAVPRNLPKKPKVVAQKRPASKATQKKANAGKKKKISKKQK